MNNTNRCQGNLPHTSALSTPACTVGARQVGSIDSWCCCWILTLPSASLSRNHNSSDQATFSQSSTVQFCRACAYYCLSDSLNQSGHSHMPHQQGISICRNATQLAPFWVKKRKKPTIIEISEKIFFLLLLHDVNITWALMLLVCICMIVWTDEIIS